MTPNSVLMKGIDKLTHVLVAGVTPDGSLYLDTSHPNYQFVNYILNRSLFNVSYLEMENFNAKKMEETAIAEQKIENAVANNVEQEIKKVRGRPKKVV